MAPVVSMVLVLGAVLITLPPVTPTIQRGGWEGVPSHAPVLWPVPPVASALHSSCCLHAQAGTVMQHSAAADTDTDILIHTHRCTQTGTTGKALAQEQSAKLS